MTRDPQWPFSDLLLLENVTVDAEGKCDFADGSVTENTRVSYPINHIEKIVRPVSKGPDAKNVIFLSADAFGVLPLADYQFGSTKGGEITKFDDFDIDFNKYKYLMETRLSGALTEPYSAIALEEPVTAG